MSRPMNEAELKHFASNIYEENCLSHFPTPDEDGEMVCDNYQLKTDAPYGSCRFCKNFLNRLDVK